MDKEDTRLYGECAYLLDKIFDKTEEMGGWDELINMLACIDDIKFKTEQELYSYYYKFIRNVYWRIHSWEEPQPFNRITKQQVALSVSNDAVPKAKLADGYLIWNYDYKVFRWALERGLTYGMSTGGIEVPASLLTPAQIEHYNKKAESK